MKYLLVLFRIKPFRKTILLSFTSVYKNFIIQRIIINCKANKKPLRGEDAQCESICMSCRSVQIVMRRQLIFQIAATTTTAATMSFRL